MNKVGVPCHLRLDPAASLWTQLQILGPARLQITKMIRFVVC